ncbi:MAG: hypothetical protein AAF799_21210 [Myxococcota bacterium]
MTKTNAKHSPGMRRRHWLLAAPAALLAMGWAARRWWAARGPEAAPSAFASLVGQRLDRWTVVRVHPPHLGAVPVVLSTDAGQRYQVDVLARDPGGPQGVAQTEDFSLFVMNSQSGHGPQGERATDEEQGLGAMVLAAALARQPVPRGLLTHRQRRQQHPTGAYAVSLS